MNLNPFSWLARADQWINGLQFRRRGGQGVREDTAFLKAFLKFTARALVLSLFIAIFMGIWYVFTHYGPADPNTNPQQFYSVPNVEPKAQPVETNDPWAGENWLSSSEARALRSQEDVVNLAYLTKDGNAKYSRDHSVTFDMDNPLWKQVHPVGIDALSVNGTAVTFTSSGNTYHLNVFQPFVLADRPNQILVVYGKDSVWAIDLDSRTLMSVTDVAGSLVAHLAPNPDLTFTY